MGLGLTIAYSIIKAHKGIITVDSVPGKGTTFSFYLPKAKDRNVTRRKEGQHSRLRRTVPREYSSWTTTARFAWC